MKCLLTQSIPAASSSTTTFKQSRQHGKEVNFLVGLVSIEIASCWIPGVVRALFVVQTVFTAHRHNCGAYFQCPFRHNKLQDNYDSVNSIRCYNLCENALKHDQMNVFTPLRVHPGVILVTSTLHTSPIAAFMCLERAILEHLRRMFNQTNWRSMCCCDLSSQKLSCIFCFDGQPPIYAWDKLEERKLVISAILRVPQAVCRFRGVFSDDQ